MEKGNGFIRYGRLAFPSDGTRNRHVFLGYCAAVLVGAMAYQLPHRDSPDFDNYIFAIENSELLLRTFLDNGPVSVLVNEPLWYLTLMAAKGITGDPARALALVVAIAASLMLISCFRMMHGPFRMAKIMLALSYPLVVQLFTTSIRQGLSVAIAAYALSYIKGKRSRPTYLVQIVMLIVASMIHVSAVAIVCAALIVKIVYKEEETKRWTIGFFVLQAVLACICGRTFLWMAGSIGIRQAGEWTVEEEYSWGSGYGFVFWLVVWVSCIVRPFDKASPANNNQTTALCYRLGVLGLSWYLGLYFIAPMCGRLWESFIPFLLIGLFGGGVRGWPVGYHIIRMVIFAQGLAIYFFSVHRPYFLGVANGQ